MGCSELDSLGQLLLLVPTAELSQPGCRVVPSHVQRLVSIPYVLLLLRFHQPWDAMGLEAPDIKVSPGIPPWGPHARQVSVGTPGMPRVLSCTSAPVSPTCQAVVAGSNRPLGVD